MILSIIMFTVSWVVIISSHPIMLLVAIMTQTSLVSVSLWFMLSNSWISFILFLIFIGGLMVLFVYIVSLASNEMFNMMSNTNIAMIILPTMIMFYVFLTFKNNQIKTEININFVHQFNKMYSMTPSFLILFTMVYLLITLVVAVKISNLKEAPIKNMFY